MTFFNSVECLRKLWRKHQIYLSLTVLNALRQVWRVGNYGCEQSLMRIFVTVTWLSKGLSTFVTTLEISFPSLWSYCQLFKQAPLSPNSALKDTPEMRVSTITPQTIDLLQRAVDWQDVAPPRSAPFASMQVGRLFSLNVCDLLVQPSSHDSSVGLLWYLSLSDNL